MMVAYRLDFQVGDWIDHKYKVVKKIGSGSYGDVFMVIDIDGIDYALKLLRLWEVSVELCDELSKRFRREYETAKLPNDYLVHSFDYNEVEGNPYYTMEYCANGELPKYVSKDLTSLPRLAHDILSGLHFLHSEGKVHRDLKPENVLIRGNGGAALTDFGVVGEIDINKRFSKRNLLGQPKQIFGTVAYMAPEMYERKGGGITYLPTIDIFSFGVLIYELLTGGHLPFGQDVSKYQLRAKKGEWDKDKLLSACPDKLWVKIIQKCIESDYRKRYQDTSEILLDMEPLIGKVSDIIYDIRNSRSSNISQLTITQGYNQGKVYILKDILKGCSRMIKIGRGESNDIVLVDDGNVYISRCHFTLEKSLKGPFWLIRDGQWHKDVRQWIPSTNGTYLNSAPVSSEGLKVFTGDIITIGEYKLKVQ